MSFYGFFRTEKDPLGRTRLWVCRGLACMLRGAYELIEHCEHKLGVRCGETTAYGGHRLLNYNAGTRAVTLPTSRRNALRE